MKLKKVSRLDERIGGGFYILFFLLRALFFYTVDYISRTKPHLCSSSLRMNKIRWNATCVDDDVISAETSTWILCVHAYVEMYFIKRKTCNAYTDIIFSDNNFYVQNTWNYKYQQSS